MQDAPLPTLGKVVRCSVVSQHPWGVIVTMRAWPDLFASVDMIHSGTHPGDLAGSGLVGSQLDAVVVDIRPTDAFRPRPWYRLSDHEDDVAYAREIGEVPPRWRP